MSLVFYLNDYGPITANVFDVDGVTPVTPLSGTATIVDQSTGTVLVEDAACQVGLGTITYVVPPDSDVTANSGKYSVYLTAEIDATTKNTTVVALDVLEKGGFGIVERWRRKVEFSAPTYAPDGTDPLGEAEGRDWIDQAVDHINAHYFDTGYTSLLGTLTAKPGVDEPTATQVEFFASVAALMAQTAWWAGKGNWRDEEMSLDTGPFAARWQALRQSLATDENSGWYTEYTGLMDQWSMYNRDKVDVFGISTKPDAYYDAAWYGNE